jgi:hypothetical protein
MATSNKVFVSPGVYTSEIDLTYVAQSVGVTTLGLVGETMMGPAFEPVLIQSWDSFNSTFGGTNPVKDGRGNPAYELPYVANSYLQESNQLFVTRVLGLTGYKPHSTFAIKTLGGVNVNTGATPTTTGVTYSADTAVHSQSSPIFNELSGKTSFDGSSITTYINKNLSGFTSSNHRSWFTIGLVPSAAINSQTGTEVVGPLTGNYTENNNNNKEWYNTFFNKTGATDSTINGVYSYLFVYNSGTTTFDVMRFKYPASLNTNYHGVVVAALRSRGEYDLTNSLDLEVTSYSAVTISSTNGINIDPFVEFTLRVTGMTSGAQSYTLSMDDTSPQFIQKVLGVSPFDKSKKSFPLYSYETYNNLLGHLFQQGYVRGLDMNIFQHLDDDNGVNDFLTDWDTPLTPTVVSEVRGGKVHDLFSIMPISDGEAANFLYKITIQNINVSTGEFDLLVRDFNDTDDNVAVLESWTRCSMDPNVPGYIALKIGTSDGSFALNSKYIMVIMSDNAPSDAFPAGFKGFVSNKSYSGKNTNGSTNTGGVLGSVAYKTKYYSAGDVVFYEADGTPVISGGETIRKVSLGLSSSANSAVSSTFDNDLFKYKGNTAKEVGEETFGFHLSVNAAAITGTTYQCTPYDLEGQSGNDNPLTNIKYCKFTFAACGGFDGWDIYRQSRTNTDAYVFGKSLYIKNNTSNGGTFSTTKGNSDYYAYQQAIQTYSNPEAVNINVFATPGLNFNDHQSLTSYAIDMVENDRADSIYIINSPNLTSTNEVVANLDNQGFDSNYSAVYFPWIQVLDTYNSTQIMIPPTGEVVRNIALTDNVAYPWFASAGYSRGIVNAKKAAFKLTLSDRDTLYQNRINPIATFSDTGTIIWGNKTLQVRESALDRINVRRLLLQARKLISAVAVRLLFEQNDDTVRQEFLRLVNPILDTIKKERGLTDFRVTVSSDPADIDNNLLSGKIFIQPTRSLEFIDLEFIITPTGASFENL